MVNFNFKKFFAALLRNKEQLAKLFDYFNAEDIEDGILAIPEGFINKDLHSFLLSRSDYMLTDYFIQFQGDLIHLLVDLNLKQIGPISMRYILTVEDLRFNQGNHMLKLSYKEEAKSKGNILQNVALKAIAFKGSYAKLASEYIKCPYLTVDDRFITLQLDKFPEIEKLPVNLSLTYESSKNGTLTLRFDI